MPGRNCEPVIGGQSGALVWRCSNEGLATLYVKAAPLSVDLRLDREADRLRWMVAHHIPVPEVRDYCRIHDVEYLVVDEIPGVPASDPEWASSLPEVIAALAYGLRVLHGTDVTGCPFDHSVARQIEDARIQVNRGRVREEDFDEARAGRRAADLFAELVASAPASEDLVFTHGDFCLPNVILRRSEPGGDVEIAGLVDCGRAGVADRYQDLALAVRSITYNHGSEFVPAFLRRYGLARPDEEKLSFFTLLDEFF
ncbi:MAG: aminoglycoside 3'-phosphotransferase [Anaerolineae bacterium]|nr:aminoglycoside 3'-phosphotransferase [Gemmatimonadaceae bacterium]